ncbi:MAG TPA: ABC transporter permease [Vicinamibacterales bacterium]|nr:ABC transporter permease [Vicinamibacterales bacterium]
MSEQLFRLLLLTLPADLRRDFGDDMAQLFHDYRRELTGRPVHLLSLWFGAAYDVAAQAVAARAPRRAARPRWNDRETPAEPEFARTGGIVMRTVLGDFRHGFRLLRRYPASSLLALATLAIGIGANTAIFSVVDRVLLRALPYPDPDRIVMVWEKRLREGVMNNVVSPADYRDWRARNTVFEHMAAYAGTSVSLTGDGEPVVVPGAAVGWSFFDILSVRPQLGRMFQPDDEVLGKHRVIVMGHELWRTRYGGQRDIVGRRLWLNGNAWEVVGVLPASFQFVQEIDLWVPLVFGQEVTRVSHQLDVYARLKPGVSFAQALDGMDRLGQQLEAEYPQENRGHGAHVTLMRDVYVKPLRATLLVLFAAVGLVLLIACVNVANLLLARAAARRREMSVRSALGASRGRLVTQTLVESVSLSVVGGVAGCVIGWVLLQALPAVMPERMSVVGLEQIRLDLRVLLFSFGLALLTGVLFGLLPALQASKPDMTDTLKQGGRGSAGVRRRARIALVIGEVTLAALTLVGAGLVVRSFSQTMAQPLGFDSSQRLTFTLSVPPARYKTPEERRAVLLDLERRFAALPGVRSVGAVHLLPLGGGDSRTGIAIENRETKPDDPPTRMHPRIATPSYFSTMGIPIKQGRGFETTDDDRAIAVVVISETSARRFWPNANPIGQRVRFGDDDTWRTIVGIAGDVRHWGLRRDINPALYWPQAQASSSFLTFVLQGDVDPGSLTGPVRLTVAAIDPNLPLASVRTLDEVVAESVRSERAQTLLLAAFGVLALVLAVIGVYGVMAQLVTTRVHEIGVRMTLGARPFDILRQLMTEGLWQALVGLAIGLVAGSYIMRLGGLPEEMLFHIQPWDPITLTAVGVILIVATLAACLIPARRAMRVEPVNALRQS